MDSNELNSSRPNPDEIKELLEEDQPVSRPPKRASNTEAAGGRNLSFLYDVPLQISVEVGRANILLKDLLKMGEGYVIELNKPAGEPLDLYVNSRLIAKGEAVMVGDKFGIRLIDVVSTADRVENLGK